jgi:hypothetical protein
MVVHNRFNNSLISRFYRTSALHTTLDSRLSLYFFCYKHKSKRYGFVTLYDRIYLLHSSAQSFKRWNDSIYCWIFAFDGRTNMEIISDYV